MTRQRLTKFEYATLFLAQKGLCGCGCRQRLEAGKVDEEHSRPVGLLGDPKPDSLWRRDCHRRKTKEDIARIAKANAQGGRTGQWARRKKNGSKLKSRNTLGGEARKALKKWAERMKEQQE